MRVKYSGAPDYPRFGDVIKIKEFPREGAHFMVIGNSVNAMNAYLQRLDHFEYPDRIAPMENGIERGNLTSPFWSHYREEPDE